jgi:hypothetical protein
MGGQKTTSGDWDGLSGGFSSRCQGEGRGFESRRPLSAKHLLKLPFEGRLVGCGAVAVPMVCPWSPYRSVMPGSLRQAAGSAFRSVDRRHHGPVRPERDTGLADDQIVCLFIHCAVDFNDQRHEVRAIHVRFHSAAKVAPGEKI